MHLMRQFQKMPKRQPQQWIAAFAQDSQVQEKMLSDASNPFITSQAFVATFVVFGWSVAALAARFAWVSPPSAGHSIVVHKLVSTRAGY